MEGGEERRDGSNGEMQRSLMQVPATCAGAGATALANGSGCPSRRWGSGREGQGGLERVTEGQGRARASESPLRLHSPRYSRYPHKRTPARASPLQSTTLRVLPSTSSLSSTSTSSSMGSVASMCPSRPRYGPGRYRLAPFTMTCYFQAGPTPVTSTEATVLHSRYSRALSRCSRYSVRCSHVGGPPSCPTPLPMPLSLWMASWMLQRRSTLPRVPG